MSTNHIFVYGSLRREFRSPARKVLENHADYVGEATFQAKLYMIDWYPGVVESDDPKDIVLGEVYKMNNERIVLTKLDQYEGCSPSDSKPQEFERRRETVNLINGKDIEVWVYIYVLHATEKKAIHSGDYVKYSSASR